jgi:hypothetical protein
MPEVIDCPSCGRKLRRPASVVGQVVQCPTCAATFMAVASAEELPPVLAVPVDIAPTLADEPSGGDVPLQLSLDEATPRAVAGLPPPPPPLVAVPVEPLPHGRATSPCPDCGTLLPHDAGHCVHCGRELDDPDRAGPSFARYLPRRDLEPHRGGLVLTLGVLSVVLLPIYPVSFLLGILAWIKGRKDLRKMQANVMDPTGMANTRGGYICGIVGTLAGGAATLCCLLGWLR